VLPDADKLWPAALRQIDHLIDDEALVEVIADRFRRLEPESGKGHRCVGCHSLDGLPIRWSCIHRIDERAVPSPDRQSGALGYRRVDVVRHLRRISFRTKAFE